MQCTAKMVVLPWPRPITIPDSTKSTAYQAACCLNCDTSPFTLSAPQSCLRSDLLNRFSPPITSSPPQVKTDHPPPGVQQRLPVAHRLGCLQHAEGHRRGQRSCFIGDGRVTRVVGSELDEEAVSGVAFVQLAGGVQEARPVAYRRRQPDAQRR